MEMPWAPMPVSASPAPVIATAPPLTHPPIITSVRVLPPTTYVSPKSALSRISDVVSEMERELSEDLRINGDAMVERDSHHDVVSEKEFVDMRRQRDGYRQRLNELEGQISDYSLGEENHNWQHGVHITRIAELEQLLGDAKAAEERLIQGGAISNARVAELERLLADINASSGERGELQERLADTEQALESYKRRDVEFRSRVNELEQELVDERSAHSVHRTRVSEAERLLQEAHNEGESLRKRDTTHASRIKELELVVVDHAVQRKTIADLEHQLAEANAESGNHVRQHHHHKSHVTELEQRLSHAEAASENHRRQSTTHRERADHAEQQLQEVRYSEGRDRDRLRARIQELEQEVDSIQAQLQVVRRQEDAHRTRLTVLEQELVEAKNREVSLHGQVLAQKREANQLQLELETTKRAAETVQLDAEQALQTQTNLDASREREWHEKLLQANERIRELEMQVQSQLRVETSGVNEERVAIVSKQETTRRLSSQRQSLIGFIAPPSMSSTRIELLPSSTDPFVLRVREASRNVAQTLQSATNVHVTSIESQVAAASEAHRAGRAAREFELDSLRAQEIEAQQRTAKSSVEAAMHDLKALREELEIQHQLTASSRSDIAGRIDIDLAKCEDELRLLQSPSTLSALPDEVVRDLVAVHMQGVSSSATLREDGLTPMHQATQHGRRDIVEYLLRLEGGGQQSTMLHSRDRHGHTPLYYAQSSQQRGLEHYLREDVGLPPLSPPARRESILARRPNVAGIPQQYLQLLQQIETTGWHSVSWKNGYTMLHWAAGRGHGELFRYLVQLNADPTTRDYQSRSPLDIAKQSGNIEVLSIVQETLERQT